MKTKDKQKKCSHNNIAPISSRRQKHTYCYNCGIIAVLKEINTTFLYKPTRMEKQTELDPLVIVDNMKQNNLILIQNSDPVTPWYLGKRKVVVGYLQRLSLKLKYSDATFYTALTYLDFLLKTSEEEVKGKKLEMIIIVCFILAAKFAENDIFEPELNQFESSNGKYVFSSIDLLTTEIDVLQRLNHKLTYHSVYDWLFLFLNNGFIFEDEMSEKSGEDINKIYASCKKSLAVVTSSTLFLDYNPLAIAFGLIEIARNNINLNPERMDIIKSLYKIDEDETYEHCLFELQSILLDSNGLKAVSDVHINKEHTIRKLTFNPSPEKKNLSNLRTVKSTVINEDQKCIRPPLPIRNKKIFGTVKEENKLILHSITSKSLDNRKNSFINKVDLIRNENSGRISKPGLTNKPFFGNSMNFDQRKSLFFNNYEAKSSNKVKLRSSSELPFSSNKITKNCKQILTKKKNAFRSDTKLPIIGQSKQIIQDN